MLNNRLASIRTPWTDIVRMRDSSPESRARLLEMMAEKYYEPVRVFIRTVSGHSQPADIDDRTQMFFQKFLEKDWLGMLDREKGSFRGFLMTAVRSFILDRKEHEGRKIEANKRYAEHIHHEYEKVSPAAQAEVEYNRAWARGLVKDAIEVFREECLDRGKAHYYEVFEQQLFHPEKYDSPSYLETAQSLNISEKDVANCLHRGKKHINALLRELVRNSVLTDEEVDGEMQVLRSYF